MKTILLQKILEKISYTEFKGNPEQVITQFRRIDEQVTSDSMLWVNKKNISKLDNIDRGTIIVPSNEPITFKSTCNYLVVENPRATFQEILSLFFVEKRTNTISKNAIIDESATIGEDVFIGSNVVIEKNCKIGNNTSINHNTVILNDTIIGNNVTIGANNTIGGIGFGYEKDKNQEFQLIPHIGNVVIKDNVDIGNNTCIDRAVLGSTILDENVKVDNLVHIAHGVHIGKNTVVIANSMVAGSVKVGENSWIAPSASILNQKQIGNNSLVGLGAVILKDVGDNEIHAGNPAKFIRKI